MPETIPATARWASFSPDGATNTFPVGFKITTAGLGSDIVVKYKAAGANSYVTLDEGSDFEVVLDNPSAIHSTFSVRTLDDGGDPYDIGAGTLIVYGSKSISQLANITPTPTPTLLETVVNLLTVYIQNQEEWRKRAIHTPLTETAPSSAEFPAFGVADSGKLLQIDATGALALVSSVTGIDVVMSAIGQAIATAANAAAVLTLLGISGLDTTTSFVKTLLDDADAGTFLTTLGVSAFIQTLLNDADAATARATLGSPGVFQSAQKAITAAATGTEAHGLGGVPLMVVAQLECITTDLGYQVGDMAMVFASSPGGGANTGLTVWADATNVGYLIGSGGRIDIQNRSGGGALGQIANANWKLRVVAIR